MHITREKRPHIPKEIRQRVLNKFGGRCGYCGCVPEKLCLDHIRPYAFEGCGDIRNHEDNFMPACFQCNNFKSAMSLEEFRRELSLQAERALKYSINHKMALKYGLIRETHLAEIRFYFETVDHTK
jgi:5-methylcytosine-specific restriction endonuclease McrA